MVNDVRVELVCTMGELNIGLLDAEAGRSERARTVLELVLAAVY